MCCNEHDFRRLDDDGDLVALFQSHLLRATPRDHALDLVLADAHDRMRHDIAECNLDDLSFDLIPG
jgi:hypothetical protein